MLHFQVITHCRKVYIRLDLTPSCKYTLPLPSSVNGPVINSSRDSSNFGFPWGLFAGNLTTVALVSFIGNRLSTADEFFIFAGGCVVAMLLLAWAGSGFVYKRKEGAAPPIETLIGHPSEDRIHAA